MFVVHITHNTAAEMGEPGAAPPGDDWEDKGLWYIVSAKWMQVRY